ncbi:hypothetical protein AR457_10025 [Streptomyces agglomeratus]|uniref:14-3-3 family protein n=1 Tax=Streptomyces agglomeratus TaxID=285458 RepID=UPI00085503D8|nr:14-3-3 family protein [Streptomyces agglomeratus]OEJ41233.1 hypothetical protein BGK70_26630 [Streptomyces agglomeratus]OEJ44389.1 hypothetical protein AR457_10025 [Streptomyces agglomeratus]
MESEQQVATLVAKGEEAAGQGNTYEARELFDEAMSIAMKLPSTEPERLKAVLATSTFYYRDLDRRVTACELAKRASDDAIAELDAMPEDTYQESTKLMAQLRDSLTEWCAEMQDE